uniref:SET domain-containing protein n=1 Tax=Knipowitschia caucasica TaxID=637954 RepID=A0AAV2L6N6_KNICA
MEDATIHATKAQDKTVELDVQFINPYKGRGVFAKCQFGKGDFVVEYRGDLITWEESQRRRRTYHRASAVFLYEFYWKEKIWCIDASREDGSLGRLVNDDHRHPNCKMKRVIIEGKPHLFLFALREIHPGQEITYDYGGKDWPWRKQTLEQSDADVESSDSAVFSAVLETSERPSTSTMKTQEQTIDADVESSDSAVFSAVLETSERPSTSTMKTQEQTIDADVESSDSAVFSAVLETSERPSTSTMKGLNKPERVCSSVGLIPSLVDYSDSDSDSQDLCTSPAQQIESSKTQSLVSDSDLILTDQESIPRLRRTKSIQIKDRIEFDSDDLFDPISDNSGSGEEYIPKSCEDSSEDTDEFKGKSLDDINVDPEDTVNFDSDQEGDQEGDLEDSLEHGDTTKEADLNTSQEADTDVNASQDTVTSTQGSADKRKHTMRLKGSKGRQPSIKKKWEEHEIAAVERHMMSFITSCRVPGKSDSPVSDRMSEDVSRSYTCTYRDRWQVDALLRSRFESRHDPSEALISWISNAPETNQSLLCLRVLFLQEVAAVTTTVCRIHEKETQ